MAIQPPTSSQLREVSSEVGLDLTDADVASFIGLMRSSVDANNVVDAMPDNLPSVRYPRGAGYRARRVAANGVIRGAVEADWSTPLQPPLHREPAVATASLRGSRLSLEVGETGCNSRLQYGSSGLPPLSLADSDSLEELALRRSGPPPRTESGLRSHLDADTARNQLEP
jgi:hypothetical protein